MTIPIKIIDLFAGPGGLGEGFSSFNINNQNPFKIAISIEKDSFAHQTLLLRSFYRQFKKTPQEYYDYLHGKIDIHTLFKKYPEQALNAEHEAWQAELGSEAFPHKVVTQRIKKQLVDSKDCILIGGPPCQAYSLVGRSKMSKREDFEKDPRHTLYKEYLKIIAEFKPKVFVMENVKGILSSKLDGQLIFDKILTDLKNPQKAIDPNRVKFAEKDTYTIYSIVTGNKSECSDNRDFVIRSEEYNIPQARHRVILLGVRDDIKTKPSSLEKSKKTVSVHDVISDLPKLRSGLSKQSDSYDAWKAEIERYESNAKIYANLDRGKPYLKYSNVAPKVHLNWYHDKRLEGVINHETRSHISADIHRYYFCACYAAKSKTSPKLENFPKVLLPNHKNVEQAIKNSLFNDRFRVQLKNSPATTITSHISKDGHYFIHYDPKQCRSLTVREAARIQTFPDNYKFEGQRTAQYHQVGNAVPPLLARQIAKIVYDLLTTSSEFKL